jgi:hypothetical protein
MTLAPTFATYAGLAKVDFDVPDNVWEAVVPSRYQDEFVCVECFGNFACEKQIELLPVHFPDFSSPLSTRTSAGPIVVVTPGDAPRPLTLVGEKITILASGAQTGSYEIFLHAGPENSGPPPHNHPWDESFVIKGEIEFGMGESEMTASPGTLVHLPADTDFAVFLTSADAFASPPFGAAEYIGDFTTNAAGIGSLKVDAIIAEAFVSTLVSGARVPADLDHLVFWFADPDQAKAACGLTAITPFDGDGQAGPAAMSSQGETGLEQFP